MLIRYAPIGPRGAPNERGSSARFLCLCPYASPTPCPVLTGGIALSNVCLSPYARATHCPVLTSRIVLSKLVRPDSGP
eukprot:961428-Rhodomonas_salina.2